MDRRSIYGPRDESVLASQSIHRSDDVPDGDIDGILHARRADGSFWNFFQNNPPHLRVLDLLHHMGFYGVYRCGKITYDYHLITALVERWRRETHTFHFRVGETTITLQDVAVIWALPIDGLPVVGTDVERSVPEWQEYCQQYLGFRPNASEFKGSRLLTRVIVDHLEEVEIDDYTPIETIRQYARAMALLLLGGVMCPDSSGNLVPLLYLQPLEDTDIAGQYSWGSAVLAFLYRELCNASVKGKGNIGGALQLLQIWVWSRIKPVTPSVYSHKLYMGQYELSDNRMLPVAPYGARWNANFGFTETARKSVRLFREMLDKMEHDQFCWQPYDMTLPCIRELPQACSPQLWTSKCPLIFYAIVEMHNPERVLRQFGMRQNIPQLPDQDMGLHRISRKARGGTDWNHYHRQYIVQWQRRYDTIVRRPPISGRIHTETGYEEWYNNITRRFISSSAERRVESGYQPGDASLWQIVADQMQSIRLSCDNRPQDVEGLNSVLDQHRAISENVFQIATHQQPYQYMAHENPTPQENVPTTSHRRRRSRSVRSTSSVEGDTTGGNAMFNTGISTPHTMPMFTSSGVDIAGPSTVHTPQYIPQHMSYNIQDCYVPQPPQQDDWLQSTSYTPSYNEPYSAQLDLNLGLGITQGYASGYNISPVPFPSMGAYRDHVESGSTTSSSRLQISTDNDDQTQNEPTVGEERRRPRRQRQRRTCGTGGHY